MIATSSTKPQLVAINGCTLQLELATYTLLAMAVPDTLVISTRQLASGMNGQQQSIQTFLT